MAALPGYTGGPAPQDHWMVGGYGQPQFNQPQFPQQMGTFRDPSTGQMRPPTLPSNGYGGPNYNYGGRPQMGYGMQRPYPIFMQRYGMQPPQMGGQRQLFGENMMRGYGY